MIITLYTQPNCVQCDATKRQFKKHDFVYDEINVQEDDEAREYILAAGYQQVPVVIIEHEDGELLHEWSGYRVDKIKELVESFEKQE